MNKEWVFCNRLDFIALKLSSKIETEKSKTQKLEKKFKRVQQSSWTSKKRIYVVCLGPSVGQRGAFVQIFICPFFKDWHTILWMRFGNWCLCFFYLKKYQTLIRFFLTDWKLDCNSGNFRWYNKTHHDCCIIKVINALHTFLMWLYYIAHYNRVLFDLFVCISSLFVRYGVGINNSFLNDKPKELKTNKNFYQKKHLKRRRKRARWVWNLI